MNTNISSILACGQDYVQTLKSKNNRYIVPGLLLVLATCVFAVGRWSAPTPVILQQAMSEVKLEIQQQQEILDRLSREQEANIDALSVRLAELKAASTRLDALGERLVELGQLDPAEFDFSQPAPVGGPERLIDGTHSSVMEMSQSIDHLSQVLHSQYASLDALQLLLLDRNLEKERTPSGWPVSSGWISSGFGERNDPFTGKKAQHDGLDFAGIKGSQVLSVASGVVIWSGLRAGYGKLLELDHGNGYITRYAHNDELLVKAGDGVTSGQTIARMGSTGRASSPHVHFEVLHKGEAVNPYQFVRQMR
jgi:murein DD-endopeptidase MepM/ murein hydrolase activator NlpD